MGSTLAAEAVASSAAPHRTPRTLPFLLGVMVLAWSANYAVIKLAINALPALLVTGLRASLASMLLAAVFAIRHHRRPVPLERRTLREMTVLALFGVTLNQIFFTIGMQRTTVTHGVLVQCLIPVITLLLAAAIGQERITWRKGMGIAIAFTGVAMLQILKAPGPQSATFLGDVLVLLGATAFSVFSVFSKRMQPQADGVTASLVGHSVCALVLLPVTFWLGSGVNWAQVPSSAYASLFFVAAFPSVVCYLIFFYALEHWPASRITALTYLQPVIAAAIGAVLLGEVVTMGALLAGLIVLAGVIVAGRG